MSKIYADYEDKYVKNEVLYATTTCEDGLGLLYVDEDHTVYATKDIVFNACMKGCLVKCDDTYYRPVKFMVEYEGTQCVVYSYDPENSAKVISFTSLKDE